MSFWSAECRRRDHHRPGGANYAAEGNRPQGAGAGKFWFKVVLQKLESWSRAGTKFLRASLCVVCVCVSLLQNLWIVQPQLREIIHREDLSDSFGQVFNRLANDGEARETCKLAVEARTIDTQNHVNAAVAAAAAEVLLL